VLLASVDPPAVQRAMAETWQLPFGAVSDPGGERIARPLDAWDEQASIFRPFVLVLAPDGRRVFWELSRDFTDRPDDEPVLSAVEALDLPAREATAYVWPDVVAKPSKRAFKPHSYIPYFRAIRFNTLALAQRMRDEGDRAEVEQETAMATSFLAAFDRWRERYGEG